MWEAKILVVCPPRGHFLEPHAAWQSRGLTLRAFFLTAVQGFDKVTTFGRALLYAEAEVHLPATQLLCVA